MSLCFLRNLSADLVNWYEKEITESKEKILKTVMENRAAVGLEIEFQQYKNKSKRRETELLEALEEKSKEINKLERSVQTLKNEMINNSKEELQQISRNLNDSDSSCTNCKDLNRFITSNKQLLKDYDKINSDNQSLHLNLQKITAEAESAKLKIDSLETENDSLKKDIEHLTSLHGTVEDVQNQIVSLQSEKCKLESAKEEFEILSKETACKIEEKIKISQEIQTLDAQRQTLETECEKLTSDIDANSCVREELDKLRNENDSLHSELRKIKTQVENVQLKYNDLMTENESKSESLEKLNMEILTARKQLQTLQNEYSDIQQKYEQIQAECNKHEGTIGEIQTDYNSIQNKYLQREQHRLQEEQGRNSSMSPCREKTNDSLCQENCKLKEELRNLKTQFDVMQIAIPNWCGRPDRHPSLPKADPNSNRMKWIRLPVGIAEAYEKLNQQRVELCKKLQLSDKMCSKLKEEILALQKTKREEKTTPNKNPTKIEEQSRHKEEIITQLSSKIFSLEENFKALQRKFNESKRCHLDEIHSIKSDKDKYIKELTYKNNSLSFWMFDVKEELVTLRQKFKDSKKCLADVTHLNTVLEKAKVERDDLIVQLTNNNNFRVTLSAELKIKLALLANQHEESERRLLNEAKEENNLQSSKVEDLTYKIKSLEGDLNAAQSQASERYSFLRKLDQLQIEFDFMAFKYTNLEEVRASFEAELNSTRSVGKVNALLNFLQEIQLKCDLLTSSNTEQEFKNKELTRQIKNVTERSVQSMLALKESNVSKITDLLSYIKRLLLEKATIRKELESAEENHLNKIAHLEEQIHFLSKDKSMNLPKSTISPKREKGMEHMMSENHQSKIKNMCLMDKLNSNQKLWTNEERKNRRLSSHDDRRMQSFWDSIRDVSTMTDPASADCSCSEMDKKLNEMKQKVLIRDSQVNTLSMELKTENANLKKLIIEEESKQQDLRQEIKEYKNLIVNRTNESLCAKCAEMAKKNFVDSFVQTTEIDESECHRVLPRKYEDLKIIELQDALSKGKENANNDKISSFNHQQYKVGNVVAVVIISLFLYLKR